MIEFVCPRCGTTQRVPESGAGKKVSCVRCSQRLKVPDPPEVRASHTDLPAPKPVAVKGGKQWYYQDGNKQCGPITWAELRRMAAEGELSPEDRVWGEGMAGWQAAKLIPNLFPKQAEPPPLLDAEAKGKWLEGAGVFLFAAFAGLALLVFVGYIVWKGSHSTDATDDTAPSSTQPAANAPPPAEDAEALHRALYEMGEARTELKDSDQKFGGHREEALDALDRAMHHIDEALKAVGDKHPRFHRDRDDYKKFKYDNHPHLRHTLVELKETRERLEKAHYTLGGHRDELMRSIDRAIREVDKCVDAAR